MIAIRSEITEIEAGRWKVEASPLRHAPHTVHDIADDAWSRAYSRAKGCFPDGVSRIGQILEPGRTGRQRLWRPQPGVLVPAGGGLRAGGGVTRRRMGDAQAIPIAVPHRRSDTCWVSLRLYPSYEGSARITPRHDESTKTKRALKTSATQRPQHPLCRVSGLTTRSVGKPHSSAGSSPSASRSGEPARICSAIRPEFWRIAISILAVMSGLALRNAFEFSRPWPSRWLS